MSAAGMTMETAHGMVDAPPKVEEKPEWWASSATLGLFGFGMTTILAGLQDGGWILFGSLLSMAIFFGGSAQVIAGVIALRKGNMFAGTAFTSYGMFWLAFNNLATVYLFTGSSLSGAYDVAAFTFVWFLVTFAFLLSAPKHGWGITAVFLTLTIAFILLTVQWYQLGAGNPFSHSTLQAVGAEIILTGVLAWLVGTADLTNWNYGRRIIPV
ncbi:MAG TPA: acetate uptake transporter [Thermoplasmata archaeon]|nr:acetate uptake transporter [Thermoplasmata archaeon]